MSLRSLFLGAIVFPALAISEDTCPSLTTDEASHLVAYVSKKYQLPPSLHLSISESPLVSSCYRKLVFTGAGPLGPVALILYLSPDHRYLSVELLDSAVDPEREFALKAQQAMIETTEGRYASRGPDDAPVTVVIFSDFECPYCRKAAQAMSEDAVLQGNRQVRQVYRHLPLSQHSWARTAAEAAACAQFQSANAFWSLHDLLFADQAKITAEDVTSRIFEMAARISTIDQKAFRECVDGQMALGAVMKDIHIAEHLNVSATPTIFVNGKQTTLSGLHSTLLEELKKAGANRGSPPSSN
jgi:protein-disulfide isomerase